MAQYIVNEKTHREFKLIKFDKATNKVTLQGDLGVFEEDFDKAKLKALGYKLVTREEEEEEQVE
jgi:hypothetical protein